MPDQRSSIDEQVVKMSFDNSNFDSNINDSIKALNNLDTKLGLLNKEDFADLKNNISNLANVFTVKGQIMLGVFTSLGKKIVDVGLQLKNKLFAGIKDGLSEYNMIIDSTQTIYQNVKQSGATIDDVNKALDQLNEYADLTIYNFSEMTRMIGMFTSAGVSLKKSVATIKGLANAAALVGANSEKAQIAWQAVSRAMSSGQFTNVVWRSLELSNIAGEQFNRVITEVARANNVVGKSGKNIDEMIEKYGSLRLTLSEGWLTKDIFAEAMQIMSNDLDKMTLMNKGYTEEQADALLEIANSAEEAATQVKTFKQLIDTTKEAIGSGWASSFRILIGDLERAKRMFSRVSIVVNDFIDNNAKIRNELFSQIVNNEDKNNNIIVRGLKTGQYNFQQTIENMMAVIKTFFKSVATGFLNIFPIERISAAALKVVDVIEKATRALVLNKEQMGTDGVLGWDTKEITAVTDAIKDLIRFFRGLASAVDIAWMAFSQPIKAIVERIPFFQNFVKNTNSGIIGILKNLGNFGDKITVIRNAFKNTRIIERFVGYIIDHFNILAEQFPVLGAIVSIFKGIKNGIIAIKEAFQKLDIKPLSALFGVFKFIVEGLWNALNFVFGLLKDIKNKVDWSFLDGPKEAIIGFIKKLSDYGRGLISFKDLTGKIGEAFKKLFGAIANLFSKNKIKTGTGEIQKSFTNFGDNLTTLSEKIKKIGENVKKFLSPIAEYFKNADWSLEGIVKKIGLFAGGIGSATLGITVLAKELGKRKIVDNINELLSSGIDVVKAYQKQVESKMILNIAFAIGILAGSMLVLSLVPYEKLENGLVIFSSFMATIALTLTPVITALAKFNESLGKTKFDVLNNLTNKLGKIGKTLANSLYNKMLGEMFKDLAISIFILVGAIAALVLLFTLNGDATEKAIDGVVKMILTLAGAVLGLAFILEIVSKAGKNAQTAANSFKMFFTLSGIAAVIASLAASVVLLVFALEKMSQINTDNLKENYWYFVGLLGIMAAAAAVITGVMGWLNAFGKEYTSVKGIPFIILSIAAAVAILAYSISKIADIKTTKLKTAFKGMGKLVLGIGLVAISLAGIIGLTRQLKEFTSSSVGVIAAIVAITGMIYVLGKTDPIDESVVTALIILTVALTIIISIIALLAIITKNGGTVFSGEFVRVIKGISFSIAAVITSVGLLTAGIAALIYSLSKFNLSDADVNRASNTLVSKLKVIAKVIKDALPELGKIFYNIGRYAATMFTYFITGFTDNLIATGDMYLSIADKLVNLIIDILAKVTGLLKSRKSDVVKIIRNVVEFIGAVVTEAVNDVFKSNSDKKFTEDQVLKFLGFAGLTVGGGKVLLDVATKFNTIGTSVKNIAGLLKIVNSHLGFMWNTEHGILQNLNMNDRILLNHIADLKVIKGLGNGIAKLLSGITGKTIEYTGYVGGNTAAWFDLGAVIIAVIGAIEMAKAAYHGFRQSIGEESAYIREDITSVGDAIKNLFSDSQFRTQIFVLGGRKLWEVIVNYVLSMGDIAKAILLEGTRLLGGFVEIIGDVAIAFYGIFDPEGARKAEADWSNYFKLVEDEAYKSYSRAFERWEDFNWFGDKQFEADWDSQTIQKTANEVHDAGEYIYKNYAYGCIEGYDSLSATLSQKLTDTAKYAILSVKKQLGIASPSKVMADIYQNVMLGAIQGMKDKEESYYTYVKRIGDNTKAILENGASAFTSYLPEYLEALTGEKIPAGIDQIRNVKGFERTKNDGTKEKVDLNREYLDLIIEQKDELAKLDRQSQIDYLEDLMRARGIEYKADELETLFATILMGQSDQTKLTIAGIEAIDSATATSISELWGQRSVAVSTYLQDQMEGMNFMVDVAEDVKNKIIGKSKEEAIEILKQEAMKRGMTEAQAEETARNLMAIDAGTSDMSGKISADELDKKIDIFEQEYTAFQEMEKAKYQMAQASSDLRVQLAAGEAKANAKMQSGEWDLARYQQWRREFYNPLLDQIYAIEAPYKEQIANTKAFIEGLWANTGMSAEEAAKKWNDSVNAYTEVIDNYQTSQKDKYMSVFDYMSQLTGMFTSALGDAAGDIDLTPWNFGSGDLTGDLGLGDDDISSAVDAASDLKDGLESQRADLTPTFDLDQLASDANKATGIVMSSLMAAQNASIGDYINKDSELNPFMKDRWQNVYNFTQNNYSPKALSRIDIYRQTQRQLSMSRGF